MTTKRAGTQHKWNDVEVNLILDYIRGTVLKNEEIEKPTASAYYQLMADTLKIEGVNGVKIKAKVHNLKSSYCVAINWRSKTGQGVEEDSGVDAVKAYVLKLCPYFDQLDEIYASKVNINPPYVHDSGVHEEDDVEYLEVPEDGVIVLDNSVSPKLPSPSTSSSSASSSASRVEKIKEKLRSVGSGSGKRGEKKDALTLLNESHTQPAQVLLKKVEMEEKRLTQEGLWKEKVLELQEKRLDSEKELKLMEMDKDERIAKFRIEQEFKLQLELAKLKQ